VANLVLSQAGYKVILANNAEDALRVLSDNAIDLVIADLNMPGMNGVELSQRIRHQYTNLPILIMASVPEMQRRSMKQAIEQLLRKTDVSGWMYKPFQTQELLGNVRAVLG
jgi:DNA-binding response OmpR family regulator